MSLKTSNWMIIAGSLMLFLALCFVPGALRNDPDVSLLAMGSGLFSLGMLTIAAGVYLKARVLQLHPAAVASVPKKRVRGGCELCASHDPVIQCRVHQLQLCPGCLSNHYDFRSCVYVPASRRPAAKSGKAMAKARGV